MIANDVQQLINNNFPKDPASGVDIETHIYSVVDNDVNYNKIIILITELPSKPVTYGSNIRLDKDYQISFQVYFPEDYPYDYEEFTEKIVDTLENDGWYFQSDHILSDPETGKTFVMVDLHKTYNRKREF